MNFEQILEAIKSVGAPVVILGYVLWRGDNFLRHLIDKMGQFNGSLSNITTLMQDLIGYIKNGKS